MASIRIVPTSVSPLVILAMHERARADDLGQPMAGRAFVDDAIRRLEAAKQAEPSLAVLERIAKALGVPVTELLE